MTVVFVVLAVVLTVPVYAFAVRRLLGLRLSPLRAWIGGLIALVCASPIITAIGSSIAKHKGSWSLLPAAWFVILGVAIALLIGMLVLVIFELLVPSGTMPGPVYLVRAGRKRVRRVRRYSQIGRILVRRGMLPYLRGTRRTELHTRDGRAALARSLRLALEDGGVTFIKLGQVLATRRDLMPAEFVDELSGLQDDAAQIPWAEVEPVLDLDLRAEVEDVFASFDRTPLAAASIAQVHAATLDSGERVVVKVRRPDVDTVVAWDLDIVDRLAIRLERSTRWGRGVGAVDLSHGFAAALGEELDLRIEAQNMTAVRAAAAAGGGNGSVRIPKPHQSLCTAHVLVMERLDGRALGTIMPGEQIGDRQVLARNLLDTMLREVMIEGVFHADPHPGNVLTASGAHRSGRLDLDDLQSEKSYSPRVYGTSKLCNILFTRELARRAPELKANCFHPGVVRTGFAKNENGIWKVIATLGAPFLRSPERGARSLVWLALSDDAAALTSEYIEDEKVVAPSAQARDDNLARSLWEQSAQLVSLPADTRA